MLNLADVLHGKGSEFVVGTVTTTPGDNTVGVTIKGSEVIVPFMKSYTPAKNDAVIVLRQGLRYVVLGAYTNPTAPVAPGGDAPPPTQPTPKPPPDPTPVVTRGVRTFTAKQTACFRNGKWRTDTTKPHQGDWQGAWGRNTGAWFYGTQIRDALHGATVLGAAIKMRRTSGGVYGSVSPTVYTTPHASRPAGAPTLQGGGSALSSMAITSKTVTLPTALAQAFVDGTAFGLACWVNADDPYMVFASIADARDSGAISITYKKG